MAALTSNPYLLDTNACIALINSHPLSVRTRFTYCLDRKVQLFVSSISAFELWYGIEKKHTQRIKSRWLGRISLWNLTPSFVR